MTETPSIRRGVNIPNHQTKFNGKLREIVKVLEDRCKVSSAMNETVVKLCNIDAGDLAFVGGNEHVEVELEERSGCQHQNLTKQKFKT